MTTASPWSGRYKTTDFDDDDRLTEAAPVVSPVPIFINGVFTVVELLPPRTASSNPKVSWGKMKSDGRFAGVGVGAGVYAGSSLRRSSLPELGVGRDVILASGVGVTYPDVGSVGLIDLPSPSAVAGPVAGADVAVGAVREPSSSVG